MHVYLESRHYGYDDYEIWLAEQRYASQAFSHGMSNNSHSVTTWHLPDYLQPTEWIVTESCKAIKDRDWTSPLFFMLLIHGTSSAVNSAFKRFIIIRLNGDARTSYRGLARKTFIFSSNDFRNVKWRD